MRKKILCHLLLLSTVFTSISFLGCGSKNSSQEIEVGIILPTKDESRWLQDQARFESQLKDAGFSNEVLFSQGDLSTENTNIEALISKKIKVLIICAHEASACASAVEKAKNAGITVIAYDRLITGTDAVDYYVTFDSISVGQAQGRYFNAIIPRGKKHIPLYLYAGASTDNNSFLFFEGAWQVLQPRIANGTYIVANSAYARRLKNKSKLTKAELSKIIEQINTRWDGPISQKLATEQLLKTPVSLKGNVLVLAPNDDTSRAISEAFKKDRLIKSYKITGQDAQQASVQCILDGTQSMTVFKDTRTLATDSINMAISILKGEEPTTDTTYNNGVKDVPSKQSPIKIVTKRNVKRELIDTKYYSANDFNM